MSGSAQRALRRIVRLSCLLEVEQHGEVRAWCTNLSTTGMLIFVSAGAGGAALAPGARFGFVLPLPSQTPWRLSGECEVAWSESDAGGGRQLGLRFRLIPPDHASALDAWLRARRATVLVIDEEQEEASKYLSLEPELRVLYCSSAAAALERARQEDIRVVVASDCQSEVPWLELLDQISAVMPGACCARILISETTIAGQTQEFIQAGSLFAFLRKPFSRLQLSQVVKRATSALELEAENRRLRAELERANERLLKENLYLRQRLIGFAGFEHLVGDSASLRRTLQELDRIRRTETTVHITGETGTGKELAARALHVGGPRAQGPFVAQNCGGLSATLLHSTLFGHRRGAFTGADRDHPGLFEQARGGSLFLDEVAELPLNVQATLLRTLEAGEVTPLGATRAVRVDVRLISASHKDLRAEVRAGRMREDFYFRVAVMMVRMPPLRERADDVPPLARHFLDILCERHAKDVTGFSIEAMRALEAYPWPGNVREMENEIERQVVFAQPGQRIALELISPHIRAAGAVGDPAAPAAAAEGTRISLELGYDEALRQLGRELTDWAMAQSGGVAVRAASLLGMERTRLIKLRSRLAGPQ